MELPVFDSLRRVVKGLVSQLKISSLNTKYVFEKQPVFGLTDFEE